MEDDITALFTYDRWANTKIWDACRKLTDEQFVAEPVPGWSSVRSTVYHIAFATEWNLRSLAEDADQSIPLETDIANVDDAARLQMQAYDRFEGLVPKFTSEWLNALQTVRGPGYAFTLPRWAILRHIVIHASYHRGQVASKLKRFGIEPPNTDFFFWAVEQIPQDV